MNQVQYRRSSKRTIRSYSRGSISNSSVRTTSTAATRKDIFDNSERSPGGASSISHLKSFHSLEKSTFRFRNQSQSTVGTIREAGSIRSYTTTSTSKQEIRSLNVPSFENEDESPLPSTLRSTLRNLSTSPEPSSSSSRSYGHGVPPSTPLEDPSTKPYGDSPAELPQAAPLTGSSSRAHSGTHSYPSNHSYPHPPAPPSSNPEPPPTLYHSGSTAQRPPSRIDPRPHVDSQQSSSHTDSSISAPRRPPSIVYAPSANSSLYEYKPPVITSYPLPNMPLHKPTPQYPYGYHRVQSISDPTLKGGLFRRNSTPVHQFEEISRPRAPAPSRVRKAAHVRAKESQKKDRSRKDNLRRKRRDGAGGADNDGLDDDASFSSSSSSAPVIPLQLLHQKRPFLQRIFQFVFSNNSNST